MICVAIIIPMSAGFARKTLLLLATLGIAHVAILGIDSLNRITNDLSRLKQRTEPIRDTAGSVARLRASQDELKILAQNIASDVQGIQPLSSASSAEPTSVKTSHVNPFAPGVIVPAEKIDKPHKFNAGRLAAFQDIRDNSTKNLELLLADTTSYERVIYCAGREQLRNQLAEIGTVKPLFSDLTSFSFDAECSFLVFDEAETMYGRWFGVLDSQGTELFQKLLKILLYARGRGVTVVVVGSERLHHFLDSLRSYSDVFIGVAGQTDDSAVDSLPIVDAIVRGKGWK